MESCVLLGGIDNEWYKYFAKVNFRARKIGEKSW